MLRVTKQRVGALPIVIGLVACFAWAGGASAHSYASSGPFQVMYHANPDDFPEAGGPATLNFDFMTSPEGFQLSSCNCMVSVTDSNNHATKLASTASGATLHADYSFPKEGVYEVSVSGTAKTSGAFAPFNVTYDQRIDTTAPAGATSKNAQKVGTIAITAGIALAAGIAAFRPVVLRRHQKTRMARKV